MRQQRGGEEREKDRRENRGAVRSRRGKGIYWSPSVRVSVSGRHFFLDFVANAPTHETEDSWLVVLQ